MREEFHSNDVNNPELLNEADELKQIDYLRSQLETILNLDYVAYADFYYHISFKIGTKIRR